MGRERKGDEREESQWEGEREIRKRKVSMRNELKFYEN